MKTKSTLIFSSMFFLLNTYNHLNAQCAGNLILNGDFSAGSANWVNCTPGGLCEISWIGGYFSSSCGASGSGKVAEIDNGGSGAFPISYQRNLCQTVVGLTIGASYNLSFDYARRSTCGSITPSPVDALVSVDGGALAPSTVASNNCNWSLASYSFIATQTSHTLSILPGPLNTASCGLIVDNICLVENTILPVELFDFRLVEANRRWVDLAWQTASEQDVSYFEVRRSEDLSNWQKIGTHSAAGNSSTVLNYDFRDDEPLAGMLYYQIVTFDIDNSTSYSNIIVVSVGDLNNLEMKAYPNPSADLITVSHSRKMQTENFQLFSVLGESVPLKIVGHSENAVNLDVSELECGTYFLRNGSVMIRLIKQ